MAWRTEPLNLYQLCYAIEDYYPRGEDFDKSMAALALRRGSCSQKVAWARAWVHDGLEYCLRDDKPAPVALPLWQSKAAIDLTGKVSYEAIRLHAEELGWQVSQN